MRSRYLLKTFHKVYSAFHTFPSLTLNIIVYMLIDGLCELFWTLNMQLQAGWSRIATDIPSIVDACLG